MNEKDQDLSLEDILKEFGGTMDSPLSGEDEVPYSPPQFELEDPFAEEKATGQAVGEDFLHGDTIRLDDVAQAVSDGEPHPAQEPLDAQTKPIPRAPIPFHPNSRLHELKRKLIAGPEKRYYELSEMGLGKLQVAILVSLLVVILSAGSGVMYAMDMIPENRLRLTIFCQILAMLLGALLGCYQMLEGLGDLLKGRFTLNTMLCVTFLACGADSLFCLRELRVPLCAAFTLQVAMSLWSAYQKRNTEMGQMDTMRKATRLDSVVQIENYYAGCPGIFRGEGQVEDFMDQCQQPTGPEKAQGCYALVCLLLSAAVAAVAGMRNGASMAVQIFSTTLLVAVPASFFVSCSRPMAILERRLHTLGTVFCGWSGVKQLSRKAVYPLSDSDIFPAGSVKLNGVKFYGDRDPEVTISYATSLMSVNGGGLAPVFQQLLANRGGPKYPVKNFQAYAGGAGGEICGESVLVGSSQLLREMGVEIPAGTMVNQAVYVAIDGEFSGLFAINYARMKYSAAGLSTLCGYRNVTALVTADDFLLTPEFLKEKFGVSIRRMVCPSRDEKAALAEVAPAEDAPVLALTTREGLAPAAYTVTGARAVRTACNLGLMIHMIGGALGILIMLALAVLGRTELLTPLNILLYQLVWMIPGLLVTEWTRSI